MRTCARIRKSAGYANVVWTILASSAPRIGCCRYIAKYMAIDSANPWRIWNSPTVARPVGISAQSSRPSSGRRVRLSASAMSTFSAITVMRTPISGETPSELMPSTQTRQPSSSVIVLTMKRTIERLLDQRCMIQSGSASRKYAT